MLSTWSYNQHSVTPKWKVAKRIDVTPFGIQETNWKAALVNRVPMPSEMMCAAPMFVVTK
jgi:hypothetical protein